MNKNSWPLVQLLLSIFVMSTSGVLGRFIALPVPTTIWIRCVIASLMLYLYLKWSKDILFVGWGKPLKIVVISSIFMGVHWVTYFWSLKLSSVAVAMLSLFTYPVITAFLEPFFLKTKFKLPEIILAGLAFSGVFFLVPEFDIDNDITMGVLVGIISSLFYSIRNLLLKQTIGQFSGITLMYHQVFILAIVMMPVVFFSPLDFQIEVVQTQWYAILALGIFTTAVGHTLLVKSFRYFTITTVSIITCLSPLLGIGQGYLFLNEKPTNQVAIGGLIILSAVIIESVRTMRKSTT